MRLYVTLLAGLALVSDSAISASWTRYGPTKKNGDVFEVDTASIRWKGNTCKLWTRWFYEKNKFFSGILQRIQVDCDEETVGVEQTIFNRKDGVRDREGGRPPISPEPDSPFDFLMKDLCSTPSAPPPKKK
jgi:hypothetical protein